MPKLESVIAELDLNVKGVSSIEQGKKALRGYEDQAKKAKKGTLEYQEAVKNAEVTQGKLNDKLRDSKGRFIKQNKEFEGATKGVNKFSGSLGSLARNAVPWLTAIFSVSKLIDFKRYLTDIDNKYNDLRANIQRLAGLQGSALDNATTKISSLSTVFKKDVDDMTDAINSFAKQSEIGFGEALILAEKGFLQGADARGDFLSKLKEYPIQFRKAGLSAQQLVRIMTQEVRGGVFDDKLSDTIKETGLRLRELTPAAIAALKPLGENFQQSVIKDVQEGKKSIISILGEIYKEAKRTGLPIKDIQTLIADLGGGPLEDLGGLEEAFKQVEIAMSLNLDASDDLTLKQAELLRQTELLADEELRLGKNVEGLSTYFSNLATTIQTESISALNFFIEKFQDISTKSRIIKEGFEGMTLEQLVDESEKLNKELSEVQGKIDGGLSRFYFSQSDIDEIYQRRDLLVDGLKEINKLQKQLNSQGGGGTDGSDGGENPDGGTKLTAEEQAKRTKELQRQRRELEAYNKLIEGIGFSLRKSQIALEDSTFRKLEDTFNLDRDKIVSKLKEDIERLNKQGASAGIPKVELEAEIANLEETAKNEIDKLRKEFAKQLKVGKKGLIDIEDIFGEPGELGKEGLAGLDANKKFVDDQNSRSLGKRIAEEEQEELARRKQAYNDFYEDIRFAAFEFTNYQISLLDYEINQRQSRIDKLASIQSESAERALIVEEERQQKAIAKQQEFVRIQKTLAAIQGATNIFLGITRVFAESGVASIGTLPAVLGVLGAVLAGAPAIASSVLGYKEGVIDFKGLGTETSDSNLVTISNHESVITAKGTKLAPKSLELINNGKLTDDMILNNPDLSPIVKMNSGGSASNHEVTKELKAQNQLMEAMLYSMGNLTQVDYIHDEHGVRKRTKKMNARESKLAARR